MLPGLTTEQMIKVDQIMVEKFDIAVPLMMENAGLNLARLVVDSVKEQNSKILVVCGNGNNGGGGAVSSRRLHAWGFQTAICLPSGTSKLRHLARQQVERAKKLGIPILETLEDGRNWISDASIQIIVDAYIGYGFVGQPSEMAKNTFSFYKDFEHIICLDAPSGTDTSTGQQVGGFIPTITLTLAFPKTGLLVDSVQTGKLYLADIGIPKLLYEKMLGIDWSKYNLTSLERLYDQFSRKSLIEIEKVVHEGNFLWLPSSS